MRISRWIKPLRFLIALCVLNMVLCFLIEPVRGSSGTMWEEYYREEELDTVFIGASFCAATFEPYIFDEQLGVKSFNMGTPLQAVKQNISALKTALEDHDIKTVVIGMGFFSLQEDSLEQAELTFEKAKAEKKGGFWGMAEGMKYIFSEDVRDTEKSINFLFPWLYNQQEISWEFISQNVVAKLNGEQTNQNERSKKGYRPYIGIVDYETADEINSYQYYNQNFDPEVVGHFEELLALCADSNVDVVVVNTPHPTFDVVSCHETYAENEMKVAAICESYGVDYYNFSLVKPEIFEAKQEYFYDFEHLNEEGSKLFSKMFCEFLQRRAQGESLDGYFYSVEEYLEINGNGEV